MAIIIQENKQQRLSNILYIIIWIILILGILVGIYYVFFKKPEIYESTLSINKNVADNEIDNVLKAKSYVDLNNVIQMTQSLKNYINIPKDFVVGKDNPFF